MSDILSAKTTKLENEPKNCTFIHSFIHSYIRASTCAWGQNDEIHTEV